MTKLAIRINTSIALCSGTAAALFVMRKSFGFFQKRKVSYVLCPIEKTPLSGQTFTVSQFNILASNLASSYHFPYVIPAHLDWNYRSTTLLTQMKQMDSDILCLQELADYWTFFKPALAKIGYDSVYVKRPSLNKSTWSGDKKLDGCGIFYRSEKFKLLECESTNYHDDHDRVALFALLRMKKTNRLVLVATTHIWWNSKKVDHQIAEILELENELISLHERMFLKYNGHISIVVCGDFNNVPESPVYDYMENHFLRKKEEKNIHVTMTSAYNCYQMCSGVETTYGGKKEGQPGKLAEPRHTTVNYRRASTIDYIWYSSECLHRKKLLAIPSESELRKEEGPEGWLSIAMANGGERSGRLPSGLHGNHNGIPNSVHGSDHVPLMVELDFIQKFLPKTIN